MLKFLFRHRFSYVDIAALYALTYAWYKCNPWLAVGLTIGAVIFIVAAEVELKPNE
jgi:hypothetical protein